MSKPNRGGTHSAAAQAIRLITLLLLGSIVAAAVSAAIYLSLSQTPPAAAQQPAQTRQQPTQTRQQPTQTRQQPAQTRQQPAHTSQQPMQPRRQPAQTTRIIPRSVTVEDADGKRTETVYETVQMRDSHMVSVPDSFPRTGSLPQTAADRRSLELAGKLRQTNDAGEAERLRSELVDVLSTAFDERQKMQQQEIQRLEERLQSIRELARRRQELKETIVQRRMEELLGNRDMLAWDVSPALQTHAVPLFNPLAVPTPTDLDARPGPFYTAPVTPHLGQPVVPRRSVSADPFAAPVQNDPFDRPAEREPSADPFGADPFAADTFGAQAAQAADDPFGGAVPMRPRSESLSRGGVSVDQAVSPRSDASFELAERLLTLTSRTALLKNRIAAIENERANPSAVYYGSRSNVQHQIDALRAELHNTETMLRLAQIAWEGLGERLQVELAAAQGELRGAEVHLRQTADLRRAGAVPLVELTKAEHAVAVAKSQLQIAEGRRHTWAESDQLVKDRWQAILEAPTEPPATPAAAADDTVAPTSEAEQKVEADAFDPGNGADRE